MKIRNIGDIEPPPPASIFHSIQAPRSHLESFVANMNSRFSTSGGQGSLKLILMQSSSGDMFVLLSVLYNIYVCQNVCISVCMTSDSGDCVKSLYNYSILYRNHVESDSGDCVKSLYNYSILYRNHVESDSGDCVKSLYNDARASGGQSGRSFLQ